nr:type VI secretion system-associated protein TagF [Ciceribacter sp. L1K22]
MPPSAAPRRSREEVQVDTVGFFGKVPAARDFVFHGLPVRLTEAWAGIVSSWLSERRTHGGPDWARDMLRSPVWRFLLPEGIPGGGFGGAAGLVATSVDSAGRIFPFCVMLATDGAGIPSQPDAAVDHIMDGIESRMLGFMETQSHRDSFLAELHTALRHFPRHHPPAPSSYLRAGEAAAIFLGTEPAWRMTVPMESFFVTATGDETRQECHWWHDGLGESIGPQHLVSRGLPVGAAAAPLFSSNWKEGWQPRATTEGM